MLCFSNVSQFGILYSCLYKGNSPTDNWPTRRFTDGVFFTDSRLTDTTSDRHDKSQTKIKKKKKKKKNNNKKKKKKLTETLDDTHRQLLFLENE